MRLVHRLISAALALAIPLIAPRARAEGVNAPAQPTANARTRDVKLIVLLDTMSLQSDAPLVGAHVGAQLGRWISLETGVDRFVPYQDPAAHAGVLVPLQAWLHLGPGEHTIDFGGGPEISNGGELAFYRMALVYRYAHAPNGLLVRGGVAFGWTNVTIFGVDSSLGFGLEPQVSVGWRL
jgi:hypothetical protein